MFEFTDDNFQVEVLDSDVLVVVDFWAKWCGPCNMIGPIIEELALEYDGKVKIGKLNIDENIEIPTKYEISGIPAIKFIKNGKVVGEIIGFNSKNILKEKIESLI